MEQKLINKKNINNFLKLKKKLLRIFKVLISNKVNTKTNKLLTTTKLKNKKINLF